MPAAALALLILAPVLGGWHDAAQTTAALPDYRIDLNVANAATLQLLPGVGPAVADAVVATRRDGLFTSPADLVRVRGVGEVLARRIEPYVTTHRP